MIYVHHYCRQDPDEEEEGSLVIDPKLQVKGTAITPNRPVSYSFTFVCVQHCFTYTTRDPGTFHQNYTSYSRSLDHCLVFF